MCLAQNLVHSKCSINVYYSVFTPGFLLAGRKKKSRPREPKTSNTRCSPLPSVIFFSSTSVSDVPKLPFSPNPLSSPYVLSADGFVTYFKPKTKAIWIELHQPLVLLPKNLSTTAPNLGYFPGVLEDDKSSPLLWVNSSTLTLGLSSAEGHCLNPCFSLLFL